MTVKHGANGYTNHACRCEKCREGHRERVKGQREARKQRLAEDPSLAEHGKPATYCNWACRCVACTAAWAKDLRDKRKAKEANG